MRTGTISELLLALLLGAVGLASNGCGYNNTTSASTGAPGAAPTGSLAQPATFTQVNQQIFQPVCSTCHGPGGQSPDLASYSGFASNTQYVVPGNAAASLIYTITESGQMPLGGPPLSQAQEDLLAGWIDAGAPDN